MMALRDRDLLAQGERQPDVLKLRVHTGIPAADRPIAAHERVLDDALAGRVDAKDGAGCDGRVDV